MMELQTSLILILLTGSALVSCKKGDYISYLERAMEMIEKAKDNTPICVEGNERQTNGMQKAVDCADLFEMGFNKTGVYEIWPMNRVTEGKSLEVYCDMHTDNGGWTVIQRRLAYGRSFFNDWKDFDKYWKDYKRGFSASLEHGFWLGNDNIFALTNQKRYSVRFDLEDYNGKITFAVYDEFWIDDENHKYTLHISNYTGNAGDAMADVNNKMFSTSEQDNPDAYCYNEQSKGGYWFQKCTFTNLNGVHYKRRHEYLEGIIWQNRPQVWSEIKIRPKNYL